MIEVGNFSIEFPYSVIDPLMPTVQKQLEKFHFNESFAGKSKIAKEYEGVFFRA